MKYAKLLSKKATPQSQPIPGSGQVPNSAGGHAWTVNPIQMLDRFLILGSESGTFYVDAVPLTVAHAENIRALIEQYGLRVVSRIAEVSEAGRAPKNYPAIFALAMAAAYGSDEVRTAALQALPRVCRTGTHLFQFAEAVDGMRGWGRGLRKAIGRWYNDKSPQELAYQLLKYGQREGWSHRDLMRLAHQKPATELHDALYKWVVDGDPVPPVPSIQAVLELQGASVEAAADLIRTHRLPREALPTELLTAPAVWEALLADMPMTAMIRNLGVMSKIGLLTSGSVAAKLVVDRLSDRDRLRKARVHPIAVLLAQRTYASGHGLRGSGAWAPVTSVIDALDDAFYAAFESVEPTEKRYLLGIDVSGSMGFPLKAGVTCAEAAAAMAMVTLRTEPACTPMAFAHEFRPLHLSARMRLDDVLRHTTNQNFGGTDCALPMLYAADAKLQVDVFVVYTDSETWFEKVHPVQALAEYRHKTGIPAKLVVMGMAGNRYTIADPKDPGMLDVVGFDASVPVALEAFVRG